MRKPLLFPLAALTLAFLIRSAKPQTPAPPAPAAKHQSSSPAVDRQRQRELDALLAIGEPGAQRRGLEDFLRRYPGAPERHAIYTALLHDAAKLNDDQGVLRYNEKLEALDPGDMAQRIKTINLLLLETDPADRQRARADAATLAAEVEQKAKEPPPDDVSAVAWRIDIARLRSVAALFQGTAAQNLQQWPQAEQFLARSLQQAQTEQAAEHLGDVYVAEAKIPQAVDSFALALALPGQTIAGRAKLRARAGALYRQLHQGSEAGFGDLILRRFDQVAARDANQQSELHGPGANAAAANAGQFALESLDGRVHRLAQARGKLVVADFWATWCGPCRVQHPLIAALRRRFAKDHRVIFIAIDEDADRARVAPFLRAQGWGRSTWLDAGLGAFLGVDALPATLIFSPAGAVVYRQEGFNPATFETQLGQAIRQELARAFPQTPVAAR